MDCVAPDFDDVVGSYAKDVRVERRVVQLAEGEPVGNVARLRQIVSVGVFLPQ